MAEVTEEHEALHQEYVTLRHLKRLQDIQNLINDANAALNEEINKLWAYRQQLIEFKEQGYGEPNPPEHETTTRPAG